MKLHKDGTLEGTPEEIAEFMKLKDPMFGKMHMPLATPNGGIYACVTTAEKISNYSGQQNSV